MKKATRMMLLMVGMLVLAGLACSSSDVKLGATPTPAQSGSILYKDDFSNPKSGWDTWNDDMSQVKYVDGGLHFVVKKAQYDFWSRPAKRFTDARIAVEAKKINGPDDNDFGILCRYKDRNNFYMLIISSDSYAGVIKVKDGNYSIISGSQLQRNEAIHRGNETNFIGADCVGSRLILYANGKQLAQATDNEFTSGEVGLIAGSYSEAGVEIEFHNFYVAVP